jgi:hypothetical protein
MVISLNAETFTVQAHPTAKVNLGGLTIEDLVKGANLRERLVDIGGAHG